jgi:hypothetical protein
MLAIQHLQPETRAISDRDHGSLATTPRAFLWKASMFAIQPLHGITRPGRLKFMQPADAF